jgi:hypothetical protein
MNIMKTTTTASVQAARNAYRALLAFSGVSPAKFRDECAGLIREYEDGEGEGEDKWTPADWLRAADEAAWALTTNWGRDKAAEARFVAFKATVKFT